MNFALSIPENAPELLSLPAGWLVLVLFLCFTAAISLVGMLLKDARDREALMSATAAKSAQALLDMVGLTSKLDANFRSHAENDAAAFSVLTADVKGMRQEMDERWDSLRGMQTQIEEIRRLVKS